MAQNITHPVYNYTSSKTVKRERGEWLYNCNQPKCCWGSNNLHTFLEHLNESHDIEYLSCEYREVIDRCCGQLMPSKIWNVLHLLQHAYDNKKREPKLWDRRWDADNLFLEQVFARIKKEQQLICRYLKRKKREFADKKADECSSKKAKLNE